MRAWGPSLTQACSKGSRRACSCLPAPNPCAAPTSDLSSCPACSYGTASIAAPELLSEGRLTKASDVYGAGAVMPCTL